MLYESEYYGICSFGPSLAHHGIKGQKWGVQNGPPYPLSAEKKARVRMNSKNEADVWYTDITNKELLGYPKEELSQLARLPVKMSDDMIAQVRAEINIGNGNDSGGGRSYNCPNCAAAFDMVERGYAVAARPKKNGSNVENIESFFIGGKLVNSFGYSDYDKSIYETYRKYNDLDVKSAKVLFPSQKEALRSESNKLYEELWSATTAVQDRVKEKTLSELSAQGNGAHGIMVVGWRMTEDPNIRTTHFHAFNYKVENGEARFYDTQSSRSYKQNGDVGHGFFYESDPRDIYYMRTDNLEPSPKITDAVYSNRKRGSK